MAIVKTNKKLSLILRKISFFLLINIKKKTLKTNINVNINKWFKLKNEIIKKKEIK